MPTILITVSFRVQDRIKSIMIAGLTARGNQRSYIRDWSTRHEQWTISEELGSAPKDTVQITLEKALQQRYSNTYKTQIIDFELCRDAVAPIQARSHKFKMPEQIRASQRRKIFGLLKAAA